MRPAHLHFLVFKDGIKTQFSQVYSNDDPYLVTDVQFGVTQALVGQYEQQINKPFPSDQVTGDWWRLDFTFKVEPGQSYLPTPPITQKVSA